MALLMVSIFAGTVAAQPPEPKRHALVIGNQSYSHLPQAPGFASNAAAVSKQLETLNFSPILRQNLNHRELTPAVDDFVRSVGPGETALIYFSGYGMHNEDQDNYLLPIDFDPADPRPEAGTAENLADWVQMIADRKPYQIVIVLDVAWECPALQVDRRMFSPRRMRLPAHTLVSRNPDSPPLNSQSSFTANLVSKLAVQGIKLLEAFGGDMTMESPNNFALSKAPPVGPPPPKLPQVGDTRTHPKDELFYVYIPDGSFQMGCVPNDKCQPDEKPRHPVEISAGFWLTSSEVTVGAYDTFVKATGHPAAPPSKTNYGGIGRDLPQSMVTWTDAQDYCKWVGGRLPTEAEWEYAARGGKEGLIYPWGNTINHDNAKYFEKNPKKPFLEITPVRFPKFAANAWGLHGMAGNVREWVADWYSSTAYAAFPANSAVQDPKGPEQGDKRVIRGGSWDQDEKHQRVSSRESRPPDKPDNQTGFRCVVPVWP